MLSCCKLRRSYLDRRSQRSLTRLTCLPQGGRLRLLLSSRESFQRVDLDAAAAKAPRVRLKKLSEFPPSLQLGRALCKRSEIIVSSRHKLPQAAMWEIFAHRGFWESLASRLRLKRNLEPCGPMETRAGTYG